MQVLGALEHLVAFCKEYATDVSARLAASGSEASPRGGGFPPAAPLQHSSSSGQLTRTQSLAGLEVAAQHQVFIPLMDRSLVTSPLEPRALPCVLLIFRVWDCVGLPTWPLSLDGS